MNKFGIAGVAVVLLSGEALARAGSHNETFIDGGEARVIGIYTRAQLDAMKGVISRNTSIYATNWTSDSNGATFTAGNIASANLALGQGGWAYYCASGAGTSPINYKINAGSPAGRIGQKLQITGSNSTIYGRYLIQDWHELWVARNFGDNIAWVEYDQYVSSASSTSGSRTGGFLNGVDSTGSVSCVLVGMALDSGTSGTSTKQRSVFGYAAYTSGSSTGSYRFKLSEQALAGGGTTPLATSGGWTKHCMCWNKRTGEVKWFYSVDDGATYTGFSVCGAGAGFDVAEWDFHSAQLTGTTTANAIFGDFGSYATADHCPSDLDGNGLVDTADISLLLMDFGTCAGCTSDLDGHGVVDTADLSLLLLDFGTCPS